MWCMLCIICSQCVSNLFTAWKHEQLDCESSPYRLVVGVIRRTNIGACKGERQTKVRLNSVFFKNYRPFVERDLQIKLSLIQLCSSEVRKRYIMAIIDQTIFLHSMLPLSKNFIIVHTTFVMHSFLCGKNSTVIQRKRSQFSFSSSTRQTKIYL